MQSTLAATEEALDALHQPNPNHDEVPRPKKGPAYNRGCHPGALSSSRAAGVHSARGGSPHTCTCPANHRLHHKVEEPSETQNA